MAASVLLASCNGVIDSSVPKHERPLPDDLVKSIKAKGMTVASPILLRIFKEENTLEVWKKKTGTQRYALLNSYEICKWSGELGPKLKEGDKQAPEGFYHVTPGLMNPNSSYHLSFNMGFPNKYDRANDRTGSYLMVHGACSSAGCYSMTDEIVEEIYGLAREAFRGGQKAFQVQAYPFRMTPKNLAEKVGHRDFEFWKMLKEGSDHFEVTKQQPKVNVCEKRYVFNRDVEEGIGFRSREICPPAKVKQSLALAFNERQDKDQNVFDRILKQNALNPFTKDKPKITSASIKANPTQGPVSIAVPVQPKPVEEVVPETDEKPSTTDHDPIAAEVTPSDGSTSEPSVAVPVPSPNLTDQNPAPAQATSQEISQIAVPQQANRNQQ